MTSSTSRRCRSLVIGLILVFKSSLAAPAVVESQGRFDQGPTTFLVAIDAEVADGCGSDPRLRERIAQCPVGLSAGQCLRSSASATSGPTTRRGSSAAPAEFLIDGSLLDRVNETTTSALQTTRELTKTVAKELPTPALSGVIDDFFSTQLFSYLQGIGDLDEPQSLGYTFTLDKVPYIRARVSAFATPDPNINPRLKAQLVGQNQALSLGKIEDDLDIGDDYLIDGTVALVTKWIGPEFNHSASASELLVFRTRADRATEYLTALQQIPLKVVDKKRDPVEVARASCLLQRLTAINYIDPGRYMPDFWKLVANQPQLSIRYRRLHRDGTVGASADSFRIRAASGLSNLTWLMMSGCKNGFGTPACVAAYDKEFGSWRLRHGLGIAAYYERGKIADISIDIPFFDESTLPELPLPLPLPEEAGDGTFRLDGGRYQRFGAALGMSLLDPSPEDVVPQSMRVDLAGDIYRYQNDPVRVDHEVARITLTYRRGPLSFPFHVMYRTRSEFEARLGEDLVVGIGSGLSF